MLDNAKYIFDVLSSINSNSTYKIDEDYILKADTKAHKYKDNNGKRRTYEEKRLDIDCEFADEIVLHSHHASILEATEVRKHDFKISKMVGNSSVVYAVDNKVVHDTEFFLHMNKYTQYLESYRQGQLEYFAFWKFSERPTQPLKIGDKPEMLLLSVIPTETLLMKMCDPRNMTKTKDKFKIKIV